MLIWGLHTSQYLVIFKGKTCIFNFLQYNYFLNEFEGIKFWVVTLHIFRLNSLKFSFSFDIYWQSKVKTWIAVAHLLYLYTCNQENYIHTISYDGFYFQVLRYKYYYWQKSNSDGSPKEINVYKQNTTKDITTFIAMLHNMSRPNHVTSICQPRTSTDADF